MSKISSETDSSHEGACLRYMLCQNRPMRGQFKICDEAESPIEGVCFRYMMTRNRQMRGRVFRMYVEPESPNEGGVFILRYMSTSTGSSNSPR